MRAARSSVVDDRAVLGHLADDEFAVVLPDADAAHACAVAEEVLVALQQAFDLDRVSLEVSGSSAIDHEELTLHFQQQLDARTGELLGVEALVRWPHPERGLLAPGEIVSLAEKTRLIRPLTRLVLTQALRQSAA